MSSQLVKLASSSLWIQSPDNTVGLLGTLFNADFIC